MSLTRVEYYSLTPYLSDRTTEFGNNMIEIKEGTKLKKLVICIPVHGKSDALIKSLQSIDKYVRLVCQEKGICCVLLISNSGEKIDIGDYWQGESKIIQVPSNFYWGASVKSLFAEAREYKPTHVLLMNHDILLIPTSFSSLLDNIPNHPNSILSSISVVLETKKIENAGFQYVNNSIPFLNVYMDSLYDELSAHSYQVDALNGRFLLFPFEAANPEYLKPFFVPHYFADTVLSVLARRAGFPLVVVPTAMIWSDQSDTEFKRARTRCSSIRGFYNCLFKPYSYRYIWGGLWGQIFLVDNLAQGLFVSLKYTSLRIAKSVCELIGIVKVI
jgi:GT2 family glycosyltransferase